MCNMIVVGDLHFSEFSSIIRRKNHRLDNGVSTLNWVESHECRIIVYLGDFFDKPELNAEEITALQKVKWNGSAHHIILVGNHELGRSDLDCSSTQALNFIPNSIIISKPTLISSQSLLGMNSFLPELLFLPYIVEEKDRVLGNYTINASKEVPLIAFSHNDIKGVPMGHFISQEGFDIKEIESNCNLFINGHLHNGTQISSRVINLGNITGQNFSEDAFQYEHHIMVLNLLTGEGEFIENPYAFNFYKLECTPQNYSHFKLKNHSILSVKTPQDCVPIMRKLLEEDPRVEEFRVIGISEVKEEDEDTIKILTETDHIEQFKNYILNQLGKSDYLLKEIQEIL